MWDDVQELKLKLGRDGMYGLRNRDLIPLAGLIQLRNATLEDNTLRTVGGAATFGSAITGTPKLLRGIDYWVDETTQRAIVMGNDGKLWKDDGAGGGWTEVTGLAALTVSGAVPHFTNAGREATGKNAACFYADGLNRERVLRADGSFAALTAPPTTWAGTNRPRGFALGQGYNFGFGQANLPHHLIRSLDTDHEDFTTTSFAVSIFGGQSMYISAALEFKGFLIVWKFPEKVYAYDIRDPTPSNWRAWTLGQAGAPGPGAVCVMENDVLWVDITGGWHLLSATQEAGSMRAEDITYRKLNRFIPDTLSRTMLTRCQLVYNADRQKAVLACAAQGTTALNRRLTLDLNNKAEVGERWVLEDRDVNECLFLRRDTDNVSKPIMGDDAGQLWKLDQTARTKSGSGYTFEWWTADTDFAALVPKFAGKKINGAYLQAIYDPRSSADHTIRVWRDGSQKQSITLSLSAGPNALPVTLPFTLGAETMLATPKRQLLGAARRWGFQGISTVNNADVSLAGLILGMYVGRE